MPAEALLTAQSLHTGTDAIVVVVVPVLAACLRRGSGSFFGDKWGMRNKKKKKKGVGGVWSAAHGARAGHVPVLQTKRASRCSSGPQSSRTRIGGRGNVGTRLTKAFMFGGGLNGQKDTGTGCFPMQRRRGTPASGILFTQQRPQMFEASVVGNHGSLREVLLADLQYKQSRISVRA